MVRQMLKRAMIVQKVAKMCAFVNNVQTRGLLLCARCGRSFTNAHKMLCWILTVKVEKIRKRKDTFKIIKSEKHIKLKLKYI